MLSGDPVSLREMWSSVSFGCYVEWLKMHFGGFVPQSLDGSVRDKTKLFLLVSLADGSRVQGHPGTACTPVSRCDCCFGEKPFSLWRTIEVCLLLLGSGAG